MRQRANAMQSTTLMQTVIHNLTRRIMQLAEPSSWDTYYRTQFNSLFGDYH